MARDTCRRPTCSNDPGQQDRDDYDTRYCSVQCQVKYEHVKAEAREARLTEEGR